MKKFFLLSVLCLMTFSANAQMAVSDSSAISYGKTNIGWLEYQAKDKGFGLGMNFIVGYFSIGADFYSMDDVKNTMRNATGWKVRMGGNYHLKYKRLSFDAGIGILYNHFSYEYPSGSHEVEHSSIALGDYTTTVNDWSKDSNGDFGLYVNPRVNIEVYKSFGITASYRWDFNKFKFDEISTDDFFTVGLVFGL